MTHPSRVASVAGGVLLFLFSCGKDETVGYPEFRVPAGFPEPVYHPELNGMTPEGYRLGKKLFYEPLLSKDGTVSCGDCHKQWSAFADGGHALSHGINNLFGTRNSPPIFNLAWMPYFMWDGGINHIEVMPIAPITNPVEMDESLTGVISKLNADAEYRQQFGQVFGTEEASSQRLLTALAWFMTSVVSADSRYDRYLQGGETLTATEMQGMELFMERCASCHTPPLFTNYAFENNGLDLVFQDSGRARITGNPMDMGLFKVPSLRNVEKTGPYMHDGRFATLTQALEHYQSGIKNSPTLSDNFTGGQGLLLTDAEKTAVEAFLRTLTDLTLMENEVYAKD